MGRVDKTSGVDDARGEAETADIGPAQFPQYLLWALHRVEAPSALAQVRLVEVDAHGDDLVISPGRSARARDMHHGG